MKIIGHRGGQSDPAKQNTLDSIAQAIKHKIEAVEIDVRVSRDMIPVLNHDNYVNVGDRTLLVRTATLSELKAFKHDLATLTEVLKTAHNKVKLLIEIKPVEPIEPIIGVIKLALNGGFDTKNITICSFDFHILSQVKRTLPEVRIAVSEQWSGVRAGHRARRLNTKHLIMNQRWLWVGYVRPLANRGYDITAFTVNDPKRAERLARMGVGSIVTDYPSKF